MSDSRGHLHVSIPWSASLQNLLLVAFCEDDIYTFLKSSLIILWTRHSWWHLYTINIDIWYSDYTSLLQSSITWSWKYNYDCSKTKWLDWIVQIVIPPFVRYNEWRFCVYIVSIKIYIVQCTPLLTKNPALLSGGGCTLADWNTMCLKISFGQDSPFNN